MKEEETLGGIGFIGAGKVGFALGKYLSDHGERLTGYYSRTYESANQAATFTNSLSFKSLSDLVESSDTLFITVPDREISGVWDCMKEAADLKGKTVIHTSGACDIALFSGIKDTGAYGFSLHPLCAVSDRCHSHETLSTAIFTIEKDDSLDSVYISKANAIKKAFSNAESEVIELRSEDKTLYHAAAVVASNMMVGLSYMSEQMLKRVGFTDDAAKKALIPLLRGTVDNICRQGSVKALTGPVERNDSMTVSKHLTKLNEQESDVYKDLTRKLIEIGKLRHPEDDYSGMEELL